MCEALQSKVLLILSPHSPMQLRPLKPSQQLYLGFNGRKSSVSSLDENVLSDSWGCCVSILHVRSDVKSCPVLTFALIVLIAQFCLTLCDPMVCSPRGSSVHRILQARILEWGAIPFSRGSSQLKG